MSRTARERFAALRQSFWRHPRVTSVSKAARGVYASGLSYCADSESDGFIPERVAVVMLAEGAKRDVAELVSAGMWSTAEGGYQVVSYLEHNQSKDELAAMRSAASEAGKRGGRPKGSAKPTLKGTLYPTLTPTPEGTPKPFERVDKADLDLEGERDLPLSPPGGITEGPDPNQVGTVPWLLNCPPKPGYAWRLLHAIAELHPGPDGHPVALPGLSPSANDRTKLATILEGAEVQAKANGSTAMGELAAEWLALLSLIAAGEMERPKGPMVPYLLACFGRLEERRHADGVPFLPARTEVAA